MNLTRRATYVILGVVFFAGAFFGQLVDPNSKDAPATETKTVTKTETVTEYKTKTKYEASPACLKAGKLATKVEDATNTLDEIKYVMLEVMSNLRIAAVNGDFNAANDLETQLRAADQELTAAIATLADLSEPLSESIKECESK